MRKKVALFIAYILLVMGITDIFSVYTVEAAEDDEPFANAHWDAGWESTSIGPVTFDAPSNWFVEKGFYSPYMEYDDCEAVGLYMEYADDASVEDSVRYVTDKYDDVFVMDDDFDGYPAKFVAYTYYDKKVKADVTDHIYYIKLSEAGEVFMLLFSSPDDIYYEYVDDFFIVASTVEINKAKLKKSTTKASTAKASPSSEYIANKNTKKFHYPYCSSVSQMNESNKIYFDGTRDELIGKGYVPCQRCNP